jgi:hypothetical protein
MSTGVTRLTDLIVPAIFSRYLQLYTQQKIRLVRSGAMVLNPLLSTDLAGGGLTFNRPSFKDLDDDAENISTDDPAQKSTPNKIGTIQEIQVRMNRNQSWSSMDLAAQLAGEDPLQAITNLVTSYWARRWQGAFIAQMNGVFANNAAVTDAYHTQNDMTMDISGAGYTDGVTNFSAEAFIDACLTMGDSMDALSMVGVHSVVYGRMLKNNLIDFKSDSVNNEAIRVPTFLGREVIVDDGIPFAAGKFETWLFGAGALQYGTNPPPSSVETKRDPDAGNGSGQDTLYTRQQFCMHPVGHAYIGTSPAGGPSNAATTNNLANAASWRRVFPERKQIKIARLITREL